MISFFSQKESRGVGIDIGSSSIKVVEIARKGDKAELITYGLLEIGPYGNKEIGRVVNLSADVYSEALTDVLRESKVTTNVSGMAIPFRSSFMRLLELPSVTRAELDKMVPIEARKYIPVPMNEVSLDWSVVPQVNSISTMNGNSPESVNVLLVAIHNDVLSRFDSISQKTSLTNKFLEVESYSALRSVVPQSNETIMLCDMGAASTKIYISHKGFVVFSHIINTGSQDMTLNMSKSMRIPINEAEQIKRTQGMVRTGDGQVFTICDLVLSHILDEIADVRSSFEDKYQTRITKIVLIGGGSVIKGGREIIEKKFAIETVIADPFNSVVLPEFLRDTVSEIGPYFAVATGCALRAIFENE